LKGAKNGKKRFVFKHGNKGNGYIYRRVGEAGHQVFYQQPNRRLVHRNRRLYKTILTKGKQPHGTQRGRAETTQS
jgi:hypothetical protein